MMTSTRNQTAADSSPQSAIAMVREKLTTKPGKQILFAVQFLLSFVTLFYLRGVIQFAYNSLFYRLEIPDGEAGSYCWANIIAFIEYGLLLLFTRRQIVTRLVIMLAMPFYFPIFLYNYQHLQLIIPLAILIIVTYLASGTGEGPKTILGAVFLMCYILGAVVFFVVQSIMTPAVSETVIARDITPEGNYRYSVIQQIDQADGNTYVSVEPNTADLQYAHSVWRIKGCGREVYHERPLDTFEFEWSTAERRDITRALLRVNSGITFTLNAEQMQTLGLDIGYSQEFTAGSLTRKQRKQLGYATERDTMVENAEEQGLILIESDRTLLLNFDQMQALGLEPSYEMRLSQLSDDDLAALGVPQVSEVLMVNGKVVFRQYVAVLENSFSSENRSMMAILESNTLPEVDPEGLDLEQIRREREEAKAAKEAEEGTTTALTTTESTDTTETGTETTD